MPVVQVALHFTDEILAGIARGVYTVNGSVVRDLTGAIVMHVPEIKMPLTAVKFEMPHVPASLKDPKVLAVIGIGVVVTLGITAFVAGKKKTDATPDVPKTIQDYDSALSAYLIAIHSGSLEASILNDFIAALNSLQLAIDSGTITLQGSPELSTKLLGIVREYTTKFAEANGIEVSELDALAPDSGADSISGLRYYLETQKRIIDSAA
jgi:hypothetical protein